MRSVFLGLFLLSVTAVFAVTDSVFINRDTMTLGGNVTAFTSFNATSTLTTQNKHFQVLLSDSLVLTVFNNDSLDHTFTIKNVVESNNVIASNSSKTFTVKFTQSGTYRYYSDVPYGKLLGASGIISVVESQDIHYYWNLYETQSNASIVIWNQVDVSFPQNYTPNIFMINGWRYPNTTIDSTGQVSQQVGDTINISIINSGNMEHTLHFHGYHVRILDAKVNKTQVNWIKDTFPVLEGEAMTVQLIPHQTGMYPVHDHNLISVTNAGSYPGGMITTLDIQ